MLFLKRDCANLGSVLHRLVTAANASSRFALSVSRHCHRFSLSGIRFSDLSVSHSRALAGHHYSNLLFRPAAISGAVASRAFFFFGRGRGGGGFLGVAFFLF